MTVQDPFRKEVDTRINPLTDSMFVPVFFIGIGLAANGRALGDRWLFSVVLIVVAIVTKALGCGLLARLTGFSTEESIRVGAGIDRKSTRLNSSHLVISYAVFCLKKKTS